jgi:hypothetical protein
MATRENAESDGKEGGKMAEGYKGKIAHTGNQVVKAPQGGNAKKGSNTVKTGTDLRASGK